MKRLNKTLAIMLMAAMIVCMAPVTSVMAAASNTGGLNARGGLKGRDQKTAEPADAAANQVVVLYEDGEIPTDTGAPKLRGAKGNPQETAQEQIIDKAIDGEYTIDDTIVIETPEETANDMVVSVISSDEYSAEELADTLQEADGIKYAEPNYIYTISSVGDWNDTYINDMWQLGEQGVNVDKAPAPAESGEPVVLAVMDTGIDYTHPDLASRMWTAPEGFSLKGEHGVDWSDKDDDPMDENGHGTHCAGIIAAAANNNEGIAGIAGEAPNVQLMGVRVLDAEGSGYLEDIVRAFKYLIRAKSEGVNIKAVNCSFGAESTSDIFDEVIEQAGQAGILTIVAAGNEASNNDSTNVSPANSKSDYVVVVAATDEDGSLASYSNFGRKNVDVAAPGSNILSSVSYYNYAPSLYDADRVAATTQYYGEFGGATIETNEETGEQSVTPVLGTAYDGSEITGVDAFGASKMWSILSAGSEGKASLELTDEDPFTCGSDATSLRWKIENARAGDQYLLYFPYDKLKGQPEMNITFKPHTGYGDNDGGGELLFGDVMIDDIDSQGNVSFSCSADESWYGLYLDPTWSSIWQASGLSYGLYDRAVVKDLDEGMYGLGFVYNASYDGDIYVDISSLAISRADIDTEMYGKYDVYSGTSMATPAVTGAAGLIAAADPDIDAESLKATLLGTTTATEELKGMCSTGGRIDFAAYSSESETAKPAIASATADFAAGTVTLKGRGFGTAPTVKAFRNAAPEGEDPEIPLAATDISASGGDTITISNAGYDDYDLIGSDIRFEVTNGDKTGEASYYIVKGLTPYNDEFTTVYEEDDSYFFWGKDKNANKNSDDDWEGTGDDDEDYDGEDEEPEDPQMPTGLSYVTGSNDLYKYDSSGNIYQLSLNEKNSKYYAEAIGWPDEELKDYAEKISETVEYWKPDMKEDSETINYSLVGDPVYLGGMIYELVCVDMVDRDAYVLMGMDLNDQDHPWTIFYDSLAKFGTKPDELNFRKIENATLAALGGKIYMIGGNAQENFNEETEEYTVEICKDFFSCEPNVNGTEWKYEGELPEARTNGKAVALNGKLYYFFTNDEEGMIDYSVYAFDGSEWTKAGEIPKALFSDVKGETIEFIGDMILITEDDTPTILCGVDVDSKGIIFAGKSFDGPGDTFRFNTTTNKVEPLEYTLWQTVSDRAVDGVSYGDKFFVEYANDLTMEAVGKSFPIDSAYTVKVNTTVKGEGKGQVTAGGSYTKGDKQEVVIRPAEGSYIYSVSTKGLDPDVKKNYGKETAESTKAITATYTAEKDAQIDVYFGLVSTKVIMPAESITMQVGKRTINAHTDGTISDVKWKSSNSKLAKVNKDGTITFTKAGVGKTVTLTATSVEKPEVKESIEVKIVSRELKKFTWYGKKLTAKQKVQIDAPLPKSKTPKSFKVSKKSSKNVLSWKKVSGVNGYIVFRKTGNSRYVQIAKLSASKKSYTDKKVKKGKKYQYLVVSYKKVAGSKAVRISR